MTSPVKHKTFVVWKLSVMPLTLEVSHSQIYHIWQSKIIVVGPYVYLYLTSCIVRLLREELQVLQEPGSYVGEVIKVMGKKKVLVKVQPEGKYGK